MTPAAVEPRCWSRGRYWAVIASVFAVQFGLICWLGERMRLRSQAPERAVSLHLVQDGSELLALNDPTLFALPHPRGFSGLAWLQSTQRAFEGFTWTEPPHFLPLSAEQLGGAVFGFTSTNTGVYLPNLSQSRPELTLPAVSDGNSLPTQSTVQVLGELSARRLSSPVTLRSWEFTELLTNTVVQMLVDGNGLPVSVTLLASSGLKQADDYALVQARQTRFEAAAAETQPQNIALRDLSWGQLVFNWHTAPQPAAPATGETNR